MAESSTIKKTNLKEQEKVEKKKSTLHEKLTKVSENVLFVMFSIMVVIVFINVILRYVFNVSLVASEEIARYCFIWTIFIGAVLAMDKDEHLGVDLVVKALPEKARKWVMVLANLLLMAFSVLGTVYGFALSKLNMGWPSPGIRVSYGIIGIIMPISFLFMIIVLLVKTVELIKK